MYIYLKWSLCRTTTAPADVRSQISNGLLPLFGGGGDRYGYLVLLMVCALGVREVSTAVRCTIQSNAA